jgi:hypothetical protein
MHVHTRARAAWIRHLRTYRAPRTVALGTLLCNSLQPSPLRFMRAYVNTVHAVAAVPHHSRSLLGRVTASQCSLGRPLSLLHKSLSGQRSYRFRVSAESSERPYDPAVIQATDAYTKGDTSRDLVRDHQGAQDTHTAVLAPLLIFTGECI